MNLGLGLRRVDMSTERRSKARLGTQTSRVHAPACPSLSSQGPHGKGNEKGTSHTHRWAQRPPRRGAGTRRRALAAGEGRGVGDRVARGPAPGRRGSDRGRGRRRSGCSPPGAAAESCCRAASWLIAPGRRSE